MRFLLQSILFVLFLVSLTVAAFAETPPLPPRKNTSPVDVREQLAVEQKNKKELEVKAKSIEKDMKGLKNDLVSLTGRVQDQERELSDLETRLDQLNRDKTNIQGSLTKQKKSIADLVMALERIRRLPPETLIARPDAPLETAQAATVLAVKTAIADGIPVEDEAAGWRAAIETVIAMYEAEKRRIVRDDEV